MTSPVYSRFSLGIKEKLEEKMNEIKSLGHNIRMKLKRKKYLKKKNLSIIFFINRNERKSRIRKFYSR